MRESGSGIEVEAGTALGFFGIGGKLVAKLSAELGEELSKNALIPSGLGSREDALRFLNSHAIDFNSFDLSRKECVARYGVDGELDVVGELGEEVVA